MGNTVRLNFCWAVLNPLFLHNLRDKDYGHCALSPFLRLDSSFRWNDEGMKRSGSSWATFVPNTIGCMGSFTP
jgi:hypothetical protein